MNTTRRLCCLLALAPLAHAAMAVPARPRMQVWKSPACGCCKDWMGHIEAAGFDLQVHDSGNAAARARLGLAQEYGSCHTAEIQGYVLEGHVPAREIKRLLKERPSALGLAVPAMPVGSPGMDGPEYKGRKDAFDVLLVQTNGRSRIYQSYR